MPVAAMERKTKEHQACYFVLTMTTAAELEYAASKGLKLLKDEKIEDYLFSPKRDPFTLELQLNLELDLDRSLEPSELYGGQRLCDTSKIRMKNWRFKGRDDISQALRHISCVEVHASPHRDKKTYMVDLAFSSNDNPRHYDGTGIEGRIEGLRLCPPTVVEDADAYKSGFIMADVYKRKALFKFERKSDEVVSCSCEPCEWRAKVTFSQKHLNIIALEREDAKRVLSHL